MESLRRSERSSALRCPYCHDALAGADDPSSVGCAGCGARHHVACAAELGRCSIYGCEVSLAAPSPGEAAASGASPALRAVRRRLRERARTFVRQNVQPAPAFVRRRLDPTPLSEYDEDLRAAMRARRFAGGGRWVKERAARLRWARARRTWSPRETLRALVATLGLEGAVLAALTVLAALIVLALSLWFLFV